MPELGDHLDEHRRQPRYELRKPRLDAKATSPTSAVVPSGAAGTYRRL
jgi:hypothetical protein